MQIFLNFIQVRLAMLIKRISIISIFLIYSNLFAQPDTLWTKVYGDNNDEAGHSVQQTSDGGFFIVGSKCFNSIDTSFVYLLKTDCNGDTIWTNLFSCDRFMYGQSGEETSDGGFIAVGGAGGNFTGTSTDGIYLIKTDENGDSLWTRNYPGNVYYSGNEVHQTTDGGYIIVGYTQLTGYGREDVLLIKTDSEGDTLWTRTYGTINMDHGSSVQQTTDGGFIVSGRANSQYGGSLPEVYLVKTDSNGNVLWTQQYEYFSGAIGLCVRQTTDGGYIITGHTYTSPADLPPEMLLIKTDANGDTLWTRLFGEDYEATGYCVEETFDGGYIIGGNIYPSIHNPSDILLIKVDTNGDSLWGKIIGGDGGDWTRSIQQTQDGGFIITGGTGSYGPSNQNIWLVRLDAEGTFVDEINYSSPCSFSLHPPCPNPFNPTTALTYSLPEAGNVNLTVYDVLGKEVAVLENVYKSAGTYNIEFDGSELSSGIYFARLTILPGGGTRQYNNQMTQKMLLVK